MTLYPDPGTASVPIPDRGVSGIRIFRKTGR